MMFAQNILRIPEGSLWVLPGKAIMKKVTKIIFHFGSKWHFQICGSFLEQLSVSFLLVNTTFFILTIIIPLILVIVLKW